MPNVCTQLSLAKRVGVWHNITYSLDGRIAEKIYSYSLIDFSPLHLKLIWNVRRIVIALNVIVAIDLHTIFYFLAKMRKINLVLRTSPSYEKIEEGLARKTDHV
jgi:hypothetical protein